MGLPIDRSTNQSMNEQMINHKLKQDNINHTDYVLLFCCCKALVLTYEATFNCRSKTVHLGQSAPKVIVPLYME